MHSRYKEDDCGECAAEYAGEIMEGEGADDVLGSILGARGDGWTGMAAIRIAEYPHCLEVLAAFLCKDLMT